MKRNRYTVTFNSLIRDYSSPQVIEAGQEVANVESLDEARRVFDKLSAWDIPKWLNPLLTRLYDVRRLALRAANKTIWEGNEVLLTVDLQIPKALKERDTD